MTKRSVDISFVLRFPKKKAYVYRDRELREEKSEIL